MTLVIRLRMRLMHCERALRPALCTLYLLKLLVMWERTGTMSTKWKTRLASVFVTAFIAALLGPVAAFASPTDVDEPLEGVAQESTAQLSITEAEEPEAQTDAIVTEPSEKPAVTTEEKTNETKATTDEPGEKPAVAPKDTTEQPKVEAAKPKTTAEQPKVEAAQTTPAVNAADDATTQDDPTTGYAGDTVTWQYNSDTKTLKITATVANSSMWDFPYVDDYDPEHTHPTMVAESIASEVTTIEFDSMISGLTIGQNAFKNFTSLTTVNWTKIGMIKAIGDYAFAGCTSLRTIAIPRGVETIGAHAFEGCMDLNQVNLPVTLTSIGEDAFGDCPALDSVVFNGTSAQWAAVALPENPGYVLSNVQTTDSFTITFHPYPDEPTNTFTKMTGTDNRIIDFPDDPVLEGKTFVGWYTTTDGSTRVTSNYSFTGPGDAYGRWTDGEKKYKITFNDPGRIPIDLTTEDGMLKELPTPAPKDGYTFDGWYNAISGGEKITTKTSFEKNTPVYARWTQITGYAITFIANGGDINGGTETTFHTDATGKLSNPPDNPKRDGYTFVGWFESQDENDRSKQYVQGETAFTGDQTFYAHWDPVQVQVTTHTITFNANGGMLTGAAKLTTNANGKLTTPSNPTRSGYTFAGWWTAASGGTSVDFSKAFTADATLYAHWTKNSTGNSGSSTTNPSNPTTTNPSGSTTTKPSNSGSSASNSNSSTKPSSSTKPTTPSSSSSSTAKYKVISGANGAYAPNSGKSLTVRADGAFAKFTSLQVDGKTLTKNTHYTVREGSTIATLKPAYLDTLSSGKHTLKFNFKDGSTSTNFTVSKAPTSPDDDVDEPDANTGDEEGGPSDDEDGPSEGVVEDEGQPSEPTPSSSPTSSPAASTQNAGVQQRVDSATDDPDTGDGAMPALWLLALGAAVTGFCRVRRSRWDA